MSNSSGSSVDCASDLQDAPCKTQLFLDDISHSLSQSPKYLDSKYLYDERGSALFDQICELDEYYPTRTELAIMEQHAREIAQVIGEDSVVVELGSGSSTKTRVLLSNLRNPLSYLPIDISEEHLLKSAESLLGEFPEIDIEPVVADFTDEFCLPNHFNGHNLVFYFPGSTIGNLERTDAVRLLKHIATLRADSVGLLIGFDLVKDRRVLELAYNDSAGVSAEFSLNILHRMNRERRTDRSLEPQAALLVWVADLPSRRFRQNRFSHHRWDHSS